MSRVPIVVRPAVPEDACALLEVLSMSRPHGAATGDQGTDCAAAGDADEETKVQEATACIAQLATDPVEQLLVAEAEGTVMGAVHLRRARISPLQVAEAVHVSHLHVHPRHRRRGVASALLAAATAWADEKDSSHLLAVAPSTSRNAQRFLARIGFIQVAVVRAVATTALRHRFTTAAASRETTRLLATRRSLRRRREQLVTS